MSRLPKLVIFGRQGAGKGTIGHRVAAHLGIHHVSTGEILRREMAEATPLGLEVQSFVNDGELVPDEVMLKVIDRRLAQPDVRRRGFLLDGFPRTVDQADAFAELLGDESLHAAIQVEGRGRRRARAHPRAPRVPGVWHDDVGGSRGRVGAVPARRRLGGAAQGRHRGRDPSSARSVRRGSPAPSSRGSRSAGCS